MLDETRSIAAAAVCKLANFLGRNIKSGETWLDITEATFALVLHEGFSRTLSLSLSLSLLLLGFTITLLAEYFRVTLKRPFPRRIARGRYTLLSGPNRLVREVNTFNPLYKRTSC